MSLAFFFALWLGPVLSIWLVVEAVQAHTQAKALRGKLSEVRQAAE